MRYVFLAVFILSTLIHLYASVKKDQRLRNMTKPLILFALIGFYAIAARPRMWTVMIALLFSWIGDILLMLHGAKWFVAGGISFMVSHVFFIIRYTKDIDFAKVPVLVIVASAAVFTCAVIAVFSKLTKHLPKGLAVPMFLYLLLNGAMNCFAIFRCICVPNLQTIVTVIGALLFFISDASLFIVRFHKRSMMKTHFVVMLTYSLAELLIVLGLLRS